MFAWTQSPCWLYPIKAQSILHNLPTRHQQQMLSTVLDKKHVLVFHKEIFLPFLCWEKMCNPIKYLYFSKPKKCQYRNGSVNSQKHIMKFKRSYIEIIFIIQTQSLYIGPVFHKIQTVIKRYLLRTHFWLISCSFVWFCCCFCFVLFFTEWFSFHFMSAGISDPDFWQNSVWYWRLDYVAYNCADVDESSYPGPREVLN